MDKLGEYAGLWVAVVDNKMVAKGHTAKEVFEKAKELYPNKVLFVMKVPSDAIMVMEETKFEPFSHFCDPSCRRKE